MQPRKILLFIFTFLVTVSSSIYAQTGVFIADTLKDETGSVRYFNVAAGQPNKTAADAINILLTVFKTDDSTSFQYVKSKIKNGGIRSLLYEQVYKGVPVYDSYYYLHFKNDVFTYANGEYNSIKTVRNKVQLDKTAAINIAVGTSISKLIKYKVSDARLILWRPDMSSDYKYVYQTDIIYDDALQSKHCFIDAQTGELLMAVPVVCTVNIPCNGTTLYSGSQNFTGDTFGGGTRLRQVRNGVNISTLNNQNSVNVNAVDFLNATTTWNSTGQNAGAIDVHFATERYLDYFSSTFNRNSIDNNGHSITSYTNRWEVDDFNNPIRMDNAFFNPNDITFSYGQGLATFNSLTSLDVVAHEMGHGMAFFEVGFNVSGEARSLNEGFSDIWGATVENWSALPNRETWTVGEQIMANGFSCLRSLRNPAGEGFRGGPFFTEGNYPNTRLGPNWQAENNPPHINATVLGHWYFLLSQGGSGTNGIGNAFNVSGLGLTTAAQIAYNTELVLTPSADFISVRTASIAYAIQQWGSNSCQVINVTNAWHAVGVGDAYVNTTLQISGPSLICNSGTYSVPNLISGSTVTWSVPSNVGPVLELNQNSPAPNLLTITNRRWYGVNTTLTATITLPCSNIPITVTKNISNDNDNSSSQGGTYYQESCTFYNVTHPSQSGTLNGNAVYLHMGCLTTVTLYNMNGRTVSLGSGAQPLFWSYSPPASNTPNASGTLYLQLAYGTGGVPVTFNITGTGACYSKYLTFFPYSNNARLSSAVTYTINPNPVDDIMTITSSTVSDNTSGGKKKINSVNKAITVNVFDFNTNSLLITKKLGGFNKTYQLNVASLRTGYYALQIVSDEGIQTLKFFKL